MQVSKQPFFFFLIVLALAGGCETKPCETLVCQNGGECIEGSCVCPAGIVGKECELIVDPCVALNCVQGACVPLSPTEAFCQCESGYEGVRCERPWTAKFVALYDAVEVCDGNGLGFPMRITVGPRFNQVTMENFRNLDAKVVADLINPQVLSIYKQPMSFGFVSGSGIIASDERTVTLNYTIINGADTLLCSAILTK